MAKNYEVMKNSKIQQGVGLLIHDPNNDFFFVQRKDSSYFISEYVGSYAFWGGGVEPKDDSIKHALQRELKEELSFGFEIYSSFTFTSKGVFHVRHTMAQYDLHVFYLPLERTEFSHFSKQDVFEGEGVIRTGIDLVQSRWIWDTNDIFRSIYEKL